MQFIEGQGILAKIPYKDGPVPEYPRTYLVVEVSNEYIKVLNVSSIKGKERKLAFSTNERLQIYNPPFVKPSFVKLDSLTQVDKADWNGISILNGGRAIDGAELSRIKAMI